MDKTLKDAVRRIMIEDQSTAIKDILEALLDADSNRVIQEVQEHPTNNFDQYPAICITPEEDDPIRFTNRQNVIVRSYALMFLYQLIMTQPLLG